VAESSEPVAARLTLAEFLPYRLSVLATLASEGLARIYAARFGIGIPEWRVLATAGEFEPITAKAIGRHARMGKVKVSRAAAALEARGLVRRAPNPADLREAFLTLTGEGRRVYAALVPLALGYADALAADLSEPERAALDGLVARLTARAAALAEPGSGLAGRLDEGGLGVVEERRARRRGAPSPGQRQTRDEEGERDRDHRHRPGHGARRDEVAAARPEDADEQREAEDPGEHGSEGRP
jgi:DNA-binding MarR family transcriptional regulator